VLKFIAATATEWSDRKLQTVSSIYRPTLFLGLFNKLEVPDVDTCQGRGLRPVGVGFALWTI